MNTAEMLKEYEKKLPLSIIKELEELLPKQMNKSDFKRVVERVRKEWIKSLLEPGEGIGVITAQTFGERGTQMTLNTFHFAGVSEMNVTTGLPRIIEIFDGRKNITTPMMEIYLKKPYSQGKDLTKVAAKLKQTLLEELAEEFYINIAEMSVEITLKQDVLKEHGLTTNKVVEAIKKGIKGIKVKEKDNIIIIKKKEERVAIGVYGSPSITTVPLAAFALSFPSLLSQYITHPDEGVLGSVIGLSFIAPAICSAFSGLGTPIPILPLALITSLGCGPVASSVVENSNFPGT